MLLKNAWRELRRTASLVYPDRGFKEDVNRLKYLVRGMLLGGATGELLALMNQPGLRALAQKHPRVFSRLQWPYLTCKFRTSEKLSALRNHYSFVLERLSAPILETFARAEPWPLALIPLDGDETLGLFLRFGLYEKEGELSLSLRSETTGEWICSLSFTTVVWTAQRREILVAGIQGHGFNDEKARTVRMTRGMRGMRPKALIFFALQQLAIEWNMTALRAVGNELHIYRSLRKRREIQSDYDAFWTESAGVLQADALFDLPVVPPVRDIAEIKANKRSMYRQRYAMLDDLAPKIREAIRVV
ncbi:MAG: DUF535 family protein [Verrucomicrobiota bacterium]